MNKAKYKKIRVPGIYPNLPRLAVPDVFDPDYGGSARGMHTLESRLH